MPDIALRKLSVTYLWVVLEGSECNHVPIPVDRGYCQVRRFDQFKNFGIRVHAVVNVVLAYFYQVDDVVAVVRICSPKDDAVIVKLLLVFHNLLNFFHTFSQSSVKYVFYKICFSLD